MNQTPPYIGFAGFSGSGKTTLIKNLVQIFAAQNKRVAVIKHAHHDFQIDRQGKDSYEYRHAGAQEVLISSSKLYAHILKHDDEPNLQVLLDRVLSADLILVEGFKAEPFAKIEIHRPELAHPLLAENDKYIIAIASPNAEITANREIAKLDLNQPTEIAKFILDYFTATQTKP